MEIWKQIQGYKPIYQVSNYGRVRSIARQTNANGGVFHRKEKMLTPIQDRAGYWFVYLYREDGKHTVPVHRLVAQCFVDNPQNKPEIDHIDGDKSNNIPENLRWVTHRENCANPVTSVKQKKYVEGRAKHKCNIAAYTKEGKFVGSWETITMAAKATGTNRHSISYAAKGKYKTSNNLIWKYNG